MSSSLRRSTGSACVVLNPDPPPSSEIENRDCTSVSNEYRFDILKRRTFQEWRAPVPDRMEKTARFSRLFHQDR